MIEEQLPSETFPGTGQDELLVVLRDTSRKPLLSLRGGLDWSHTVRNLKPFTKHKIRLSLRAEMV